MKSRQLLNEKKPVDKNKFVLWGVAGLWVSVGGGIVDLKHKSLI
jgi:hypothetical protein